MKCGAVVLAGGKSRRMGREKARLTINGVSFLDQLMQELKEFPELMVSVDDERLHPQIPYPMVSDIFHNCGPMGGLHAALKACSSEALVTVPCDVPLFSGKIAEGLRQCLDSRTDAVVAVTRDGREHPLCGIYRKSCLPILEECLGERNYRMRDVLRKLKVKKYQVGKESWRLANVNTMMDYQKLGRKNCLSVCGWKNSGKTTLIERLVPLLMEEGLKVAVIKHDGHRYEPDVPGTDSARHYKAGACASIVYDEEKYSLTRRGSIDPEGLMELAPEADIFLLEGLKGSIYPKLEVMRKENQKGPIPDLRGRLAYVSDMELFQESPVFSLEDLSGIASFILRAYENGELKERWFDGENKNGRPGMPGVGGS